MEWIDYLLSWNRSDCIEISDFLDETLGTKETPLRKYTRGERTFYGKNLDDLRFYILYNEDNQNMIMIDYNKVWKEIKRKFNLTLKENQNLSFLFIKGMYNLEAVKSTIVDVDENYHKFN